jgi:hypothetical protein
MKARRRIVQLRQAANKLCSNHSTGLLGSNDFEQYQVKQQLWQDFDFLRLGYTTSLQNNKASLASLNCHESAI